MAIEQNLKVQAKDEMDSVIENEIPAYRAVSPSAVFAFILGLLSLLSFASPYFLVFTGLAILFGLKAERTIKHYPDMYTGRGIAQAGLGLGMIFGLTAITVTTVLGVIRGNSAKSFAKEMQVVMVKGSIEDLVWNMQPPARRENSTPEKMFQELRGSGRSKGQPSPFDTIFESTKALKDALAEPGADLHFLSIEKHGDVELAMYALGVYELHNPQAKKPEDKERFIGAAFKAVKNSKGRYEWWIEDLKFPYQPNSFVAEEKAVDDGHGHGPGGH